MITRNQFFSLFNRLLITIFTIWVGITLIGAIQNNHFFIENVSAITIALLLLAVLLIIIVFKLPWAYQKLSTIFIKYAYITAPLFLLLVFIWQLIFLKQTHTKIGFDAGIIHNFLKDPSGDVSYLEIYPNNLFLLFFQKYLLNFFNMKLTWLNTGYLSLICTDIAVLLNILTIKVINKKKVDLAIYLHGIFLLLFPMIIVPYSDTMVLPFVSACLLAFSCIVYFKNRISVVVVASIFLGFSAAGTYLMKPSAIIPLIAIAVVYGLYASTVMIERKINFRRIILRGVIPICSVLLFAGISINAFNHFTEEQDYVRISKGKALPPIHFISMGMLGNGSYNRENVAKTRSLKGPDAKKEYSKKVIKTRLRQLGPLGYIKFLLFKNFNNTSDGTFGWNVEGGFITAPVEKGNRGFLQSFIYPTGKHLGDFYWFAQLSWSVLLMIIVLGYDYKTKYAQMLRLSILGGFLFLLIFEGGRSRYLIQFLPVYLILATLVFENAVQRLKGIIIALR
ncbi:hypothetical protein [Liquorilactobacillus capillatus]|uniref:Integral membrane protein n=1 Tax=Liquorilactobacillus capillatus DSM 19910 TaxID=1423731 RepID=A0A0R1MD73_9LACO|nr:hypothetical protein [Liquorilactobacillus capillatus]KRL02147.1 hypothetical protein FC81_GL000910 [Liquorilactobacillus capillatus DSM 19910]